ncbi:hypothetical protein AB1Y20_018137 [Prymnesium parvum]|uniref:Fe2OG dioxygenase domain-containing protein n=1 Tax=Prymnesium parvum TaxID=97485 RepID=A0AB34JQ25_PRYPA
MLLALLPLAAAGIALSGGGSSRGILPQQALSELQRTGYVVLPNFLSAEEVEDCVGDVAQLCASGRFSSAGVGEAALNRVDEGVRRCEQCFIFPKGRQRGAGVGEVREQLFSKIDALRSALHENCGKPLDALLTEGLYVYYPHGGYYKRHLDAATGTTSALRVWSYLLYLNQAWSEEDGGWLRIFNDGGAESAPEGGPPSYVDVEPRGGTLVVFRSDSVPHEVLETRAERLALVGWLCQPLEGSSTRRSLIAGLSAALAVGSAIKFGPSLFGGQAK